MRLPFSLLSLAATLLLVLPSCTSVASRSMVSAHGRSVTHMQYQEVLDNLAMIRKVPGALPWHLLISKGNVSSQGTMSSNLSRVWPMRSVTWGATGAYQQLASWEVVPFDDTGFLRRASAIYARHAGADWIHDGLSRVPGAWTGRFGTASVWVHPADTAQLSEVVLEILDAETAPVAAKSSSSSKTRSSATPRFLPPKIQSKLSSPFSGQQMLIVPQ